MNIQMKFSQMLIKQRQVHDMLTEPVSNNTQVIQSDGRIASDYIGLYRKNCRILSDPMGTRRKLSAS